MKFRKHEKQQQNQIIATRNNARMLSRRLNLKRRAGFGLNEVIGASIAVMIAGLVVFPGLKTFSQNVMAEFSNWWDGMGGMIFMSTIS